MLGDRRYQVFISSTFQDLSEQRKQAIEVVFERGHIPIALERFSPANTSDLDVIKRVIADCQVYLLIVGHRYGELVPGRDTSFTELEYEFAEQNRLLILPFVLKDAEVETLRKGLNPEVTRDQHELCNYDKFMSFRKRIHRFRKFWGKDDQFKALVVAALDDNLPNCGKPGFLREPEEPTAALLASASQNEFIVDIVERLQSFKTLYDRCLQHNPEKRQLALLFRQKYLDSILNRQVSLFFESGSTVAYVARELAGPLSRAVKLGSNDEPTIQLTTNNVLAYLQLWLRARVPCTLFPWSPPSGDKFGASYGPIAGIQSQDPDYTLAPMCTLAKEKINHLLAAPFSLTSMRRPALLLGATSGLQIGQEPDLRFDRDLDVVSRETIGKLLGKCYGPHVGGYYNKVFKRFMYETGIPIMIFITGDKIDCPVEVGKCHFVLDSDLPWERFCVDHPLAFCVGYRQTEKERYKDMFQSLGFEIMSGQSSAANSAFIARNQQFIAQFER